jgi:hypothetical protein
MSDLLPQRSPSRFGLYLSVHIRDASGLDELSQISMLVSFTSGTQHSLVFLTGGRCFAFGRRLQRIIFIQLSFM